MCPMACLTRDRRAGALRVDSTWPANAANWTLMSASTLSAPNWLVVTNVPATVSSKFVVTLNADAAARVLPC